ncbi:MAG: hypothetical protein AAF580_05945 [Pseudomonadota bacterium]
MTVSIYPTQHLLSRTERRRLDTLQEKVERATDADRKFFKRFPDRSYRVRRAFKAESDLQDFLHASDGQAAFRCPPGYACFMAVRQIAVGARMRHPIYAPSDWDTDMTDIEAQEIYEFAANDITAGLEEVVQKAMGAAK